jgi:hypothetical protein
MSTKTTFKRIALVAVAALGFGVLTSVAPASATAGAGTFTIGTPSATRVGAVVTTPVTFTVASGTLSTGETMTIKSQLLSRPVGSAADITFAAGTQNNTYNNTDRFTVGSDRNGKTSASLNATITPDVAGTYSFLVYRASASGAAYAAGNTSAVLTFTTSAGAPASATLSPVNATSVSGISAANGGALVKVTLLDAAGTATSLTPFESFDLTALSANGYTVGFANGGNAVTALSASAFTNGVAYVNVGIAAAGAADDSVVVTAKVSGATVATLGTVQLSFLAAEVAQTTLTVGQASTTTAGKGGYGTLSSNAIPVDPSRTSHSWSLTANAAPSATLTTDYGVTVTDTSGGITGVAGLKYTRAVSLAKTLATADFAVAGAWLTTQSYILTPLTSGTAAALTVTATANTTYTATVTAPTTSILSAYKAANTFTATVTNAYGVATANVAVAVSVTGRNASVVNTNLVTGATGTVSFTLTDAAASTVINTADTVTFTPASGTAGSATINYVSAITAGTVTVAGGSKAETLAGSTLTAVYAADGAENGYVAITATVKDANGALLVGVPVTFTVDKGAIVKTATTDYSLQYTNSSGVATTRVFNWIVGEKQTITATAGGKSSTDYLTWGSATNTSARVLSATVSGNTVSFKAVDRYGNPVNGAVIDLSRVGTGFFGTGASTGTATTDVTGTVEVQFTGSAVVTGKLAATYAQAYDKAGEIAATAVTAAVAGTTTGTGASFAPAGVYSVSATVEAGSDAATSAATAASDAAAEATDAANAATDAANAAAEAADAATAAAQDAADAVAALSTQVAEMVSALKKQITALTNLVIKIQKKVRA